MSAAGWRRKAEALGVEIYPGFAATEVLYDDKGAVRGIATGDMGIARDGSHKDSFTRGMELLGKYTLFAEGARGSLTKQLIAKFSLDAKSEPPKFGIGLKEVWQIDPAKHQKGLIQHSFGWPLEQFDRRRLVPLSLRRQSRSLSASSCISTTTIRTCRRSMNSSASRPIRSIRAMFEGGKRLAYGARAITEGGYQSVPRLTFPGGALVGCAAGFVNVPRIKGVHNAMGSGMLAAEHVAAALGAGRANDELVDYENAWRDSAVGKDLYPGPQRQAAVVEVRHHHRRRRSAASTCGATRCRLLAVRNPVACQARPQDAGSGEDARADRLPEAGRQDIVRQAVVGVHVQHQPRRGPAGPSQGRRHEPAEDVRARRLCRSVESLLPGRRL